MSKVKQVLDLNNYGEETKNTILKRLVECALINLVERTTPLTELNKVDISRFLKVLITQDDINTDEITNWILQQEVYYTPFELMLMYNQMKVKSLYVRKHCKVQTTNIHKWAKDTTIKAPSLSNTILIEVVVSLMKLDFTIFDYEIFKEIRW